MKVEEPEPKEGMIVSIPQHVFEMTNGTKQGKAIVIDIESSDVCVEFEGGAKGTCQIFEIPAFGIWCGEVIEQYLNQQGNPGD